MIAGDDKFSRVALIGFDGSTLRTLEYFFQSRPAGKRFQLVQSYKDADWVVFHADQPTAKDVLNSKLTNEIGLPAIVISVKPLNWAGTISVVKPYAAHDLEAAIKKLLKVEKQKVSQRFDLPQSVTTDSAANEQNAAAANEKPPVSEELPSPAIEEPLVSEEVVQANPIVERVSSAVTAKAGFSKVTSLKEAAEKRIAIEKKQAQKRRGIESSEARVASVRAQVVARVSESAARVHDVPAELPPSTAQGDDKKKPVRSKEVSKEAPKKDVPKEKPTVEAKKRSASPTKKSVEHAKDNQPAELGDTLPAEKAVDAERKVKSPSSSSADKVKPVSAPTKRTKKVVPKVVANAAPANESVTTAAPKIAPKSKLPLTAEVASSDKEPTATALKQAVEKAQAKLQAEKSKKPTVPNHFLNMGTVFGHLPELDWDDPADKRRLSLSLEGMLLPWIEKAVIEGRKSNSSVAIDGLHLRLEYLPWTDCFVTNLSEEVLYTVMTSRFSIGELSIRSGDVLEDDLQDGIGFTERVINATDLLWLAGMWTAQGRVLPSDNPLESRLLLSVPEYIKQIKVPEVHSIIELWTQRSMTALEVKEALSIPQRYVFGVMAAAFTAKLFSTNDSSLLANERAR